MINTSNKKSPSGVNYQSSYLADHQAVNAGQIKSDRKRDAQFKPLNALTADGQRGVNDLQNQMSTNALGQMGRSLETNNAQKHLSDQMARSELAQQAAANQAKIANDIAARETSQASLAAKIKEQQIRNSYAVAQQMAVNNTARWGGTKLSKVGEVANKLFSKSLMSGLAAKQQGYDRFKRPSR